MELKRAQVLRGLANHLAKVYTEKAPKNTTGIVFEVHEVVAASELIGLVILSKSNGQKVLIKCEWLSYDNKRDTYPPGHNKAGEWRWNTLRYDHLYGLRRLIDIMYEIEQENFLANTSAVTEAPAPPAQPQSQ